MNQVPYRYPPVAPVRRRYQRTNQPPQQNVARMVFCLLLVALLGGVGFFTLNPSKIPLFGATQIDGALSTVKSTPKAEWVAGSVPLLFQTDEAWASQIYAGSPMAESGCGPTCMSMVYVALTGNTDKDPSALATYAERGGYTCAEGTEWRFFSEGAYGLGLVGEELSPTEASIRASLVAGNPVICSMTAGDFTTSGHFIVLTDIDQNGKLVVHDPNSPERSKRSWEFDTIISQCVNLWSYSLA